LCRALDIAHKTPTYPRYVEFLDALPRNGVGRVRTNQLRDAAITPDTVDPEAMGLTIGRAERR
jgi:crotonobetaine/carnitine-CoA ligase